MKNKLNKVQTSGVYPAANQLEITIGTPNNIQTYLIKCWIAVDKNWIGDSCCFPTIIWDDSFLLSSLLSESITVLIDLY